MDIVWSVLFVLIFIAFVVGFARAISTISRRNRDAVRQHADMARVKPSPYAGWPKAAPQGTRRQDSGGSPDGGGGGE